jgi:crossover junction endodeoxyribonuclease RuvC
MQNLYIGIDPGLDGAVAAIDDSRVVGIWDAPTVTVKKSGKGSKRMYVPAQMSRILSSLACSPGVDRAVIGLELVRSRPGQGVTSMFSMGHGVGLWEGIIAALGIESVQLTPQKWKKAMLGGLGGEDKNASIVQALRLHPSAAEYLTLKKHDGRAEALLMATYVRDHHMKTAAA